MQFMFGAGEFFGVPLMDYAGAAISNPTPVRLGAIQGMSLDVSSDLKELHGQYQYALDAARGKGKIGGKVEFSQINGRALNSLYFGQTLAAGAQNAIFADTTGTVIPSTPFTITVAPPSSGTFAEDMGVLLEDGTPLTRVASAPASGQYSVNVGSGVYTFNTAQAAQRAFISYRYTATLASAKSIIVNNVAMGQAPAFKALVHCDYKGKKALVVLPQTVSVKLALLATKVDDHNAQSLEYSVYSNGVGSVFEVHTAE